MVCTVSQPTRGPRRLLGTRRSWPCCRRSSYTPASPSDISTPGPARRPSRRLSGNACREMARLAELGKLDLAYPAVLAKFGIAQYREGRRVGSPMNCHDVSSEHCRRQTGVRVQRLDHYDEQEGRWREAVVQDTRHSPVSDVAAFRCDFADWYSVAPPPSADRPVPWPWATPLPRSPGGSRFRQGGSARCDGTCIGPGAASRRRSRPRQTARNPQTSRSQKCRVGGRSQAKTRWP